MAEEARWYVVHTYSGYENKVAADIEKAVENRSLHHLIEGVSIPTEKVVEIRDGKRHESERKLFPGYVLVKMIMTDESWYAVRNTRGVTGFVGPQSKAISLTDEEIYSMGLEKRSVTVEYGVGDSVKIVDGPLADCIGTVEELNVERNSVKVVVSMFGRETPVELTLEQVETLD